jgi:hypothetical protein
MLFRFWPPTQFNSLIMARYGLRTGIIAFLHTFNGRLEFNSHVHTMVTAGGWRASSGAWLRSVFYDCNILTALWRGAVLKLLREALHAGVLTTDKTTSEMEEMLKAQERWWSVKIQTIDSVEHFSNTAGDMLAVP